MSKDTERDRHADGEFGLQLERAQLAVEKAELRAERAEQRADAAEAELKLEREADLRLRKYSQFQLWERVLDAARWAPMVVALWVPFQALQPIARDFAGKDTRFDGSLKISILFSVAVTVGWGVTATTSAVRKRKIKNQRDRLTALEKELDDLQRPPHKSAEGPRSPGQRRPKEDRETAREGRR